MMEIPMISPNDAIDSNFIMYNMSQNFIADNCDAPTEKANLVKINGLVLSPNKDLKHYEYLSCFICYYRIVGCYLEIYAISNLFK